MWLWIHGFSFNLTDKNSGVEDGQKSHARGHYPHKEVWVCTVDADAAELGTLLAGQRTWRIGSKCGPTLILVSEQVWAEQTAPVMKTLHLLVRARRAIAAAAECNFESYFLPLIIERTDLLERGELSAHLTRWLSGAVAGLWKDVRPDKVR